MRVVFPAIESWHAYFSNGNNGFEGQMYIVNNKTTISHLLFSYVTVIREGFS